MKLFLWGAPCADVRREQELLRLRGFHVISLADLLETIGRNLAPREKLRLQTSGMLTAAAVVMDSDLPAAERTKCVTLCRQIGVRAVNIAELPMVPPADVHLWEILDLHDLTSRAPVADRSRRTAPPVPAAVRTNLFSRLNAHLRSRRSTHRASS
jgi:hypothetical protein